MDRHLSPRYRPPPVHTFPSMCSVSYFAQESRVLQLAALVVLSMRCTVSMDRGLFKIESALTIPKVHVPISR